MNVKRLVININNCHECIYIKNYDHYESGKGCCYTGCLKEIDSKDIPKLCPLENGTNY